MTEETTIGSQNDKTKTTTKKKPSSTHVTVRISVEGLVPHPPVRLSALRSCQSLTVYTVGSRVNGQVVADVIRQCAGSVQRIALERRDNDWDAPETTFTLDHVETLAAELRQQQSSGLLLSLQDFGMVGTIGTPLDSLVEALVTIPTLTSVTLKGDPFAMHTHRMTTTTTTSDIITHPNNNNNKHNHNEKALCLMTPHSLQALLNHLTQRLSLAGVFPEHHDYLQILFRAYVTHQCPIHIYLHFAGQSQPSSFCYFLRQVMEINQKRKFNNNSKSIISRRGRPRHKRSDAPPHPPPPHRVEEILQCLVTTRRKNHFSRDAAYWMIRENPWLCHRNTEKQESTLSSSSSPQGWKRRLSSFLRPRPRRGGPSVNAAAHS